MSAEQVTSSAFSGWMCYNKNGAEFTPERTRGTIVEALDLKTNSGVYMVI